MAGKATAYQLHLTRGKAIDRLLSTWARPQQAGRVMTNVVVMEHEHPLSKRYHFVATENRTQGSPYAWQKTSLRNIERHVLSQYGATVCVVAALFTTALTTVTLWLACPINRLLGTTGIMSLRV
jgi:hypothetical protein